MDQDVGGGILAVVDFVGGVAGFVVEEIVFGIAAGGFYGAGGGLLGGLKVFGVFD